jgi:hypothetical protein
VFLQQLQPVTTVSDGNALSLGCCLCLGRCALVQVSERIEVEAPVQQRQVNFARQRNQADSSAVHLCNQRLVNSILR